MRPLPVVDKSYIYNYSRLLFFMPDDCGYPLVVEHLNNQIMNIALYNILFASLFVIGCSSPPSSDTGGPDGQNNIGNPDTSNVEIKDSSFSGLVDALPILSLPFSAHCYTNYDAGLKVDQTSWEKYWNGNRQIPRFKIPTNGDFEVFYCLVPQDDLVPVLNTFSRDGNIIDSQPLFFSRCGDFPPWGRSSASFLSIDSTLTVICRDSTVEYATDSLYNRLPGTEKISITFRKFKVADDGAIIDIQ